jgi:hypothetical protein
MVLVLFWKSGMMSWNRSRDGNVTDNPGGKAEVDSTVVSHDRGEPPPVLEQIFKVLARIRRGKSSCHEPDVAEPRRAGLACCHGR